MVRFGSSIQSEPLDGMGRNATAETMPPAEPAPADFEAEVLPHLDAAYNLARWLTRNPQDAEDVVQEAFLRAFRFFGGFRGGNAKSWLLRIVRNTTHTWMQAKASRTSPLDTPFDEEEHGPALDLPDPEKLLLRKDGGQAVREAMEKLPAEHREILILRELEDLSYQEIAEVTGVPKGTVMSRLARARGGLRRALLQGGAKAASTGNNK